MSKYYYIPQKYNKPRKYNGKCEGCGKPTPISETYVYTDGNNVAISHNAPYLCKECYQRRYKEDIK